MLVSCWNAASTELTLLCTLVMTNEVQNAANLQQQEIMLHNWKAHGDYSI